MSSPVIGQKPFENIYKVNMALPFDPFTPNSKGVFYWLKPMYF
jgi:hypothetical protein